MPYIQNTPYDQAEMLQAIGIDSLDDLFNCIPDKIRFQGELDLPEGMSEMEIRRQIEKLGARNLPAGGRPFFLGAGVYRHFIPALVDHLAARSEFVTAYTPYQPELSQGALQTFFEFQTLICMLTGMEIANASLYDGGTALAEAVLMALDANKKRRVLISRALHPEYRRVLETYLRHLDVEIVDLPFENGLTCPAAVEAEAGGEAAAVVIQNPNFFGVIEQIHPLAEAAKKAGALSIFSVDPVSLSVLLSPGEAGADIALGEGQGLGIPLSYGGPGFGFFACRGERVRRLPGRIVGQTVDRKGSPCYVLTFQTREQHIRRERATSNICTNHALMALRSVIHLSALGRTGFRKLGDLIVHKAHRAAERIFALKGYSAAFNAPFFKEFALTCPRPAKEINAKLLEAGILGGYDLGRNFPGMEKTMLLCVTEMTGDEEVDRLVEALRGMA